MSGLGVISRRQAAKLVGAVAGSMALRGWAETPNRLSVMVWTLTRSMPFDKAVSACAEAGYSGVELVGEFQKWTPEETRRQLARMRGLGLVVDAMSGVRAGFAVPEERDTFRAQFTEHLTWMQRLECRQAILLSGDTADTISAEEQTSAAVETLKWASQKAAAVGVEIVIEPIDRLENPHIFMDGVEQAAAIARRVRIPNLLILYDLYHEQRGLGNLTEKLEQNIDLIGLIHVASVPGRREPMQGEIAYGYIFQRLTELKYGRRIAMEYYPTGDVVASLRASRQFVERG